MWRSRQVSDSAQRDAVFGAWTTWRQAAAWVQAAWDDVHTAGRCTRAAAYEQYRQALRREERAARDLASWLGEAPPAVLNLRPMAA